MPVTHRTRHHRNLISTKIRSKYHRSALGAEKGEHQWQLVAGPGTPGLPQMDVPDYLEQRRPTLFLRGHHRIKDNNAFPTHEVIETYNCVKHISRIMEFVQEEFPTMAMYYSYLPISTEIAGLTTNELFRSPRINDWLYIILYKLKKRLCFWGLNSESERGQETNEINR